MLFILFMLGIIFWEDPKNNGVTPYPDWAHQIGWVLVGLSAIQVPLWALIMSFYYLIKGRLSQVIKPTPAWGPGDKEVRRAILDEQSGIARQGKYAYDNAGMPYSSSNYHM